MTPAPPFTAPVLAARPPVPAADVSLKAAPALTVIVSLPAPVSMLKLLTQVFSFETTDTVTVSLPAPVVMLPRLALRTSTVDEPVPPR
ncbi:hypothetical protein D3C87_1801110 [compost metagenome]